MNNWYQLDTTQILQQLGVDAVSGLSQSEAKCRQAKVAPNQLIEQAAKSPWLMIWEQLTASTILILLAAASISAALGDYKDALAILAIVALTTLIGFNQEYRTAQAIAALKKLAVPKARVYRDGQYREISAHELVPGDIVWLEAGNLVPADGRLLESRNLRVQESALTGEAAPVDKETAALPKTDLPLGDRHNMVYLGTTVIYGRGRAVVTETGMNTELGRIAHLVQSVEETTTPLQQRLDQFGQKLVLAVLGLTAVIFVMGLLRGEPLQLMFLTAVSIAVGVVPEGLPAIVTIALAIGAQRMLQRQALIRKLPAVETLGSVTVICSDKTGTLTENRMTVSVLQVADGHWRLDEISSDHRLTDSSPQPPTEGVIDPHPDGIIRRSSPALNLLLTASTLCNDAVIAVNENCTASPSGDPTEIALVVAANQAGLSKSSLEAAFPRIAEIPFDSDRKRMTTVHVLTDQSLLNGKLNLLKMPYITFTKGAVNDLLKIAHHVWVNDEAKPLDECWRDRIMVANQEMAQYGMRVLGIAFRPLETLPTPVSADTVEQELLFVGLVGLNDPARPEVKQAVHTCKAAGIRPVLITGDQPLTGQHLAQELGIAENQPCLTGAHLEQLSLEQVVEQVESVSVYARVSPEQKLKIVQALQQRGHIVAMTGDGVNDAPALRQADIGVAMGIGGTDVAQEAADMVLLDDNFATIVTAIREGRVIYDNIRKCIKYLLGGNSSEIWIMFLAPLLGMPLPLLPIQILWINLLSDGLPALALSVEPAEEDTMNRPPHSPTEDIFGRGMGWSIVWIGLLMGVVCIGIGYWAWQLDRRASWQTLIFTSMTFSETCIALTIRSDRRSLFQIGLFSNLALLGAVVLTFGLQLAVIYVPVLQSFFQTTGLSLTELGLCFALSTLVFWVLEMQKWLMQWSDRRAKVQELN